MSNRRLPFTLWAFLLFLPAAAWASGGPRGGLMDPNPGLAFWTVVTFVVLFLLLKKLAWKPMIAALDQREKGIRDAIEGAEKAREEAKQMLDEARQKLEASAQDARAVLDEARQKAGRIEQDMLQKAQRECAHIQEQSLREIERAKEKALEELWLLMGSVATQVAGRLIQKALNEEDHRQLIDEALREIREKRDAS